MLLKAIHTVMGEETYKPGDLFVISNEDEARHLIEVGAAVPTQKKISLTLLAKSDTDDIATELMDSRRQNSDVEKTVHCFDK